MDRCKVNILSVLVELFWSGRGHFSIDDHAIYYAGNDEGRANGVAFNMDKSVTKFFVGYNPVNDRIITIILQGQSLNLTSIKVYAPTTASEDITKG